MEEVTALPRDPSWIWGYRFAEGRGIGEQEREGKKKRERRAGQGSVRALRIPSSIFLPKSAAAYNSKLILKTSIFIQNFYLNM